jgi:hypothetical protein
MIVRSISIRRVGDYGLYGTPVNASKPFQATIEVQGENGKVELLLSPDMSASIVAIIADEVAAAGRATAEAMTAEVFNVVALAAPGAA